MPDIPGLETTGTRTSSSTGYGLVLGLYPADRLLTSSEDQIGTGVVLWLEKHYLAISGGLCLVRNPSRG